MERTSLGEALDKLNSDVASQSVAGLDALKTWLQAPWGSVWVASLGTFNHWTIDRRTLRTWRKQMMTPKPGLLCCGCLEVMANVSWMLWHVEVPIAASNHLIGTLKMMIVRICMSRSISILSGIQCQFCFGYGETWRTSLGRLFAVRVSPGGRKGTYKAEGPQVLQQVLQHLSRRPKRQRKAAPSEKMAQLLK